ncbi:hypothetical protein AMST5_03359 [freshwater sediment metagenome]|uniref:Uncharacterized protein n=1 Tax=freshwater sediment metagenome TaxID=556182 RepID=A0AA48M2X8_9ZZZZ
MVAEIQSFYRDLDLTKLRIIRPSKFIFLCGGAIGNTRPGSRPENLRDYIYRVRPLHLTHPTVLAEDAVQLFRDSDYSDLISFEEDVARIAAVVLVIAESAGSLAELGAFASNDTIRQVLRVVIQDEYEKAESFVRYGPVQRITKAKRSNLGVYPWRTKEGKLIVASTKPHYAQLKEFISNHVEATPLRTQFANLAEAKLFYLIYWVIYICRAISSANLLNYIKLIEPDVTQSELHRKLYCMMLAKWIGKEAYSDKDYYFTRIDLDVFDYSFLPNVSDNKPVRRKLDVFQAHQSVERLPTHVRKIAAEARKAKTQ